MYMTTFPLFVLFKDLKRPQAAGEGEIDEKN